MTRTEELNAKIAALSAEIDEHDKRMDVARAQLEALAAEKKAVMALYDAAVAERNGLRPAQPGDVIISVPRGDEQ